MQRCSGATGSRASHIADYQLNAARAEGGPRGTWDPCHAERTHVRMDGRSRSDLAAASPEEVRSGEGEFGEAVSSAGEVVASRCPLAETISGGAVN